uniref:Uncharacterized protein n=1 Tax=Rhizophora mucronata TaxID=61149 RepID=A0A2P2QS12_RHIMU
MIYLILFGCCSCLYCRPHWELSAFHIDYLHMNYVILKRGQG